MFSYFLSQAQASDVSILANSPQCPKELGMVLSAASSILGRAVTEPLYGFQWPPVSENYKNSTNTQAYMILARSAAQIAREYWQGRGC